MRGMIKAMMIKELLEHNEVIGYRFRKKLRNSNIETSNGAIYYNLKKFEEKGFVKTIEEGKTKKYILTEYGRKELGYNLSTIPLKLENLMKELGSQIPFINWNSRKDVLSFYNSVSKLDYTLKLLLEDLS